MLNQPRIFRHSTFRLVLLTVIFIVIAVGVFVALGSQNILLVFPLLIFFGAIFLIALFSLTKVTTISDDGISSRSLLGEKSIRWSEIGSVSGRRYGIKLTDRDGSATIAPSPQLPGYPEVIELIGAKRPDLFNSAEYSELSRSWFSNIMFVLMGVIFLGLGVFLFFDSTDTMVPLIYLAFFGIGFLAAIFMSVLSITIEGASLVIRYFLRETTLNRADIQSIGLTVTQTRNGINYNINIYTTSKRNIRFSGVGPSIPITYLVLKNWYNKNTTPGQSGFQN